MKVGFLQEVDGSFSMRRAMALYYALLSGASLILGALNGKMTALYAGIVGVLAVLVLLGLTTIADIKGVVPTMLQVQSPGNFGATGYQPSNTTNMSQSTLADMNQVHVTAVREE